jgi:hypothetical protein
VTTAEAFFHVRILVAMITGLSISRLLTGLAQPFPHREWSRLGAVHAAWAIFLLLTIVHFWWFELGLSRIDKWTFGLYLFVIGYAILLFLTCVILFPDKMDPPDRDQYFYSRQRLFYGLLAAVFLVDLGDTALKGAAHFSALGLEYLIRQTAMVALSLTAIFVRKPLYHATFVAGAIIYQLWWAVQQFDLWS